MIGLIIGSLFFGLILGPLARLILPGKQKIGILWTFLAGFLGALVGGIVANLIGLSDTEDNIDFLRIVIQIIAAVIAVALVAMKQDRGTRTDRTTV